MQIGTAGAKLENQNSLPLPFPCQGQVWSPSLSHCWPLTSGWVSSTRPWLSFLPLWNSGCGQSIKSSTTQAPGVAAHSRSPLAGSSCKVAAALLSPRTPSFTHAPHSCTSCQFHALLYSKEGVCSYGTQNPGLLSAGVSQLPIHRQERPIKPHKFASSQFSPPQEQHFQLFCSIPSAFFLDTKQTV